MVIDFAVAKRSAAIIVLGYFALKEIKGLKTRITFLVLRRKLRALL